MTDITEQLRDAARIHVELAGQSALAATINAGADEIDRLRARVAELETVEAAARVAELERALLLIEPSGDFSGWEDKHGRDIGNSINAALAKDGA